MESGVAPDREDCEDTDREDTESGVSEIEPREPVEPRERWGARLRSATEALERLLTEFEPERCEADQAIELLELFARARKAAAGGEALAARRVDDCRIHASTGHRSTAHLLAELGGTTIARAQEVVDTGKRLRNHAATDAALRSGVVSVEQAHEVTHAAVADPGAERDLLALAGRESLRTLKDRARDVRLGADADRMARYQRQCAARSLRTGRAADGMVWGHFQLPPDTGAAVLTRLEQQADVEFRTARKDGRREDHDRYVADALVALVTGTADESANRGAEVVVHVSRSALLRGSVETDETCTIQGVGPIPVEVATEIADDAFLKGVLIDGTEVVKVQHFGRKVPAAVRTALETRSVLTDGDVCCSSEGCDQRLGLEWDHELPFASGGATSYENLRPLCRHHHRRKTCEDGRSPPDLTTAA